MITIATKNKNRMFTLYEEPIEFIAGDTIPLKFEAYQESGELVDLSYSSITITWNLYPYGDNEVPILTKTNASQSEISVSKDSLGQFTVFLQSADTIELEKMYTYQISIQASNGAVLKRIQGYIIVWP